MKNYAFEPGLRKSLQHCVGGRLMPPGRGAMDQASKIAKRAKTKAAKSKGSDSSSDELERADVSSSDEERAPIKSTKKTDKEERAAKVINQFTFS
jgi:hypothetical protein